LKQAFIAILSFLYLAVASGVEVNIHYCMGEISSVEYGTPQSGLCNKCGMESKKGCCEDEAKFVKIQDSHQLSQIAWTLESPALVPRQSFAIIDAALYGRKENYTQPATGPPFPPGVPIYIQNSVFRI